MYTCVATHLLRHPRSCALVYFCFLVFLKATQLRPCLVFFLVFLRPPLSCVLVSSVVVVVFLLLNQGSWSRPGATGLAMEPAPQLLRRQYLYIYTRKASKLSTSAWHAAPQASQYLHFYTSKASKLSTQASLYLHNCTSKQVK